MLYDSIIFSHQSMSDNKLQLVLSLIPDEAYWKFFPLPAIAIM